VAVETADVVLVKNDPARRLARHQLARKVRGKIKQNLFWAAIYNLMLFPSRPARSIRRRRSAATRVGGTGDEALDDDGDRQCAAAEPCALSQGG